MCPTVVSSVGYRHPAVGVGLGTMPAAAGLLKGPVQPAES
jgi:hypothetical protein